MQRYTISISVLAEEDLENAGDYITFVLLNPIAAENIVKGIREQVNNWMMLPYLQEWEYIKLITRIIRYSM